MNKRQKPAALFTEYYHSKLSHPVKVYHIESSKATYKRTCPTGEIVTIFWSSYNGFYSAKISFNTLTDDMDIETAINELVKAHGNKGRFWARAEEF